MLMAGVAAASSIVLSATSAVGQGSITISNPNPDGSFMGSAGSVLLTDPDTGAQFLCTTSGSTKAYEIDGVIPSATHTIPPDAQIGVAEDITIQNCPSNFGPVQVTSHPPYCVHVHDYPGVEPGTPNPANGSGYLTTCSDTASPLFTITFGFCEFDVVGAWPFYYLNEDNLANSSGTGELIFEHNVPLPQGVNGLTATDVSFCFNQVNEGDTWWLDASVTIDDPSNPSITITSP